jgi:light-regulated signal transduction histidine kinase (bacteriophytochrome)/CheY-like chemotaxis protein
VNAPLLTHSALTSCDLEPIARPEKVQSFGFLLALSSDWVVVRASANTAQFIGIGPEMALGKALDTLVDVEALHDIRNRLIGLSVGGGTERFYGVRLVAHLPPLDIAIHYVGKLRIFEGEAAGQYSGVDAAVQVKTMVSRLSRPSQLHEFHAEAAKQIRRLTGFSRVMIYRFFSDGSGEVIAEDAINGLPSFIGLHYPASDIPVQARALYLLNPFRIIADVTADTVPIMSQHNDRVPLDLSWCITRAVSAVHIEYLQNMDVAASLSISIIVDGALWGLIACHHTDPRLPAFATRTGAELFGQIYSMMLESRLRQAQDLEDSHSREATMRMLASIVANTDLLSHAGWLHDQLRPLVHCDGIAVCIAGRISLSGSTPARAAVEEIANLMRHSPSDQVFATDHLGGLGVGTEARGQEAAGFVGWALSASYSDYIVLFRAERIHEVRWAGRPEKINTDSSEIPRLSPRTSFAAFTESIRGHSRPFVARELRVAESLRSGLQQLTSRGSQSGDKDRVRTVERQELLIAELNHRVRNILALIRGLITQTNGEGGDATSYVTSLNGRVQALARAHDRVTRHNWGASPIHDIFEDEIAAYVPTQRHRFKITGAGILLHPAAFSSLALVIHELVTNCAKYGSLSGSGVVEVSMDYTFANGLVVRWRESGGPVVKTPTRRGFGSVIIERVIPFDLQGTAAVQYLPSGLEADFFIPDRHIASIDSAGAATVAVTPPVRAVPSAGAGGQPLAGLTTLLVEDSLIVALESEDMLRALGAARVITASTVIAAFNALENQAIDFAVLDINVGGENSFDLASRLRAQAIPFVFASGYGENINLGSTLHSTLTVSKPYDQDDLRFAINQTLQKLGPSASA